MRLLVLSAIASAVNVIRALATAPDVELFAVDADAFAGGLYAPGVQGYRVPPVRELQAYCAALEWIFEHHGIDAVLPSSDKDIAAFHALVESGWRPGPRHFRPPHASLRLLGDKDALMREMAVHLPGQVPESYSTVEAARMAGLTAPFVVKPTREGGGKGVAIVDSWDAAERHAARLHERFGPGLVVQEFIPGGIGSTFVVLLLYDHDGRSVYQVAMQSHLTYFTWGGGGNAGGIVDEPELVALAQAVVEAAGGWRGPVCVEVRRHAGSNRAYLMEANCRLNGYSYLTTMNGLDYPRAIVSLLRGDPPPPARLPRKEERRNFVLGFRERPVETWVGDVPGGVEGRGVAATPRLTRG